MGYWNVLSNCLLYIKFLEVMNNIRIGIDEINYRFVNKCCYYN